MNKFINIYIIFSIILHQYYSFFNTYYNFIFKLQLVIYHAITILSGNYLLISIN